MARVHRLLELFVKARVMAKVHIMNQDLPTSTAVRMHAVNSRRAMKLKHLLFTEIKRKYNNASVRKEG